MALKTDSKFKGKVTCAFKNDMRVLANVHTYLCSIVGWGQGGDGGGGGGGGGGSNCKF